MGDKGTATKGQKKEGVLCHLCKGDMVVNETCSDRQRRFALDLPAYGKPAGVEAARGRVAGKQPGVCYKCMDVWETMCYYDESEEAARARVAAEAQKKKKEGEEETQESLGKGKGGDAHA